MIEQVDFYVPASPYEDDNTQPVVEHEGWWQWAIQNGGVYGFDPDESGIFDPRPATDPPGQLPNLWLWPHSTSSAPTIKLRTGGSSRYAKIVCPLVADYTDRPFAVRALSSNMRFCFFDASKQVDPATGIQAGITLDELPLIENPPSVPVAPGYYYDSVMRVRAGGQNYGVQNGILLRDFDICWRGRLTADKRLWARGEWLRAIFRVWWFTSSGLESESACWSIERSPAGWGRATGLVGDHCTEGPNFYDCYGMRIRRTNGTIRTYRRLGTGASWSLQNTLANVPHPISHFELEFGWHHDMGYYNNRYEEIWSFLQGIGDRARVEASL